MLFSATFPDDIRALANKLLRSPVSVEVGGRNAAADKIEQAAYFVDKGQKRDLLSWLIGSGDWQQVLVFTRTKHGANKLAEQLVRDGFSAAAIHGNKSQGARTRALADFKRNAVRVLVATDIAARGLDIDQLPHVVNYDLPEVAEHYVHRIGRTGRAGNEGLAVSLVGRDERPLLKQIERLLGYAVAIRQPDGYVPPAPRPTETCPVRSSRRTAATRTHTAASLRAERRPAPRRRTQSRPRLPLGGTRAGPQPVRPRASLATAAAPVSRAGQVREA